MEENVLLLEGRVKTEKEIESHLGVFYTHIAKIVNLDNKSGSWLKSIYDSSNKIAKIKKNEPAAYKGYNITDHLEDINKDVIEQLLFDKNDINKFYLPYVYSSFPTLNSIVDRNNLNKFLETYINNTNLHLQW